MDKILDNIKALFGMPTNASKAEVDQRIQDELDAQTKGGDDQAKGEEAPPTAKAEEQAAAPKAEQPEEKPKAAESGTEADAVLSAIQSLQTSMTDKFAALDTRLKAVEEQPAGTTTKGAAEAADLGAKDSDEELIMSLPINQKLRSK